MLISIITAALLSIAPVGTEPTTAAPAEVVATHTLTVDSAIPGCVTMNGEVMDGHLALDLTSAHVAGRSGQGELSTVQLPDGRTFYMGDFLLKVQSLDLGTVEISVCRGQAVVEALPR